MRHRGPPVTEVSIDAGKADDVVRGGPALSATLESLGVRNPQGFENVD